MIKLKSILSETQINEKLFVTGRNAKEIVHSILPSTLYAKGDMESQKKHKNMVDDLIKTLNNFYEKYNIDKKIIL
jgi:hypothetical protein